MKASYRKKRILFLAVIVFLVVVYFLPVPFSQTNEVTIRAPFQRTLEQVSSLQRWKTWWPDTAGVHITGDTVFRTPGAEYRLRSKQALQVVFTQTGKPGYQILAVVPAGDTISTLEWRKISYLRTAVSDKINLLFGSHPYAPVHLLPRIKESLEDPVKYYGFPIRVEPVEDTFILVRNAYVSKATVSDRVQEGFASLQRYLDSLHYTGRAEKMFHVDSSGRDSARVMTGLSIAKPVEAKPPFRMMTMPRAHIVVGEYEGDYKNISRVHQAVSNYMKDHNIVPVAVVYEKILSDPRTSQDSMHVRVKVYHPPMIP